MDLDAAFRVLFFVNVLFPNHHVRAITTIVREFAKRIEEEMDFRSIERAMTERAPPVQSSGLGSAGSGSSGQSKHRANANRCHRRPD